ncbi:hypothetical protein PR048_029662 [Dryococelus australis]|uniref:Uncharacterized protein n=1 Tax=Dryococelus australis TaxID=614101 RepID=A0ABQ9GE20_9NEOP|nr:hypothetical protein PR048_029662 [Dryococelus australis]
MKASKQAISSGRAANYVRFRFVLEEKGEERATCPLSSFATRLRGEGGTLSRPGTATVKAVHDKHVSRNQRRAYSVFVDVSTVQSQIRVPTTEALKTLATEYFSCTATTITILHVQQSSIMAAGTERQLLQEEEEVADKKKEGDCDEGSTKCRGVGRSEVILVRWGYAKDGNIKCGCEDHMLQCRLCPASCAQDNLHQASEKWPLEVAKITGEAMGTMGGEAGRRRTRDENEEDESVFLGNTATVSSILEQRMSVYCGGCIAGATGAYGRVKKATKDAGDVQMSGPRHVCCPAKGAHSLGRLVNPAGGDFPLDRGTNNFSIRPLARERAGFNVRPGHSSFSVVGKVPDDSADRRVFSGISCFSRPCIPGLLHTQCALPSSTLKIWMLRAACYDRIEEP